MLSILTLWHDSSITRIKWAKILFNKGSIGIGTTTSIEPSSQHENATRSSNLANIIFSRIVSFTSSTNCTHQPQHSYTQLTSLYITASILQPSNHPPFLPPSACHCILAWDHAGGQQTGLMCEWPRSTHLALRAGDVTRSGESRHSKFASFTESLSNPPFQTYWSQRLTGRYPLGAFYEKRIFATTLQFLRMQYAYLYEIVIGRFA